MRVGFVGLGKLGLPVAVCMAQRHDVMGTDINPLRMTKDDPQYIEAGPNGDGDFQQHLALADKLIFGTLDQVVAFADLIFVAVQTPHDPKYEGITPIGGEPKDFDYSYLKEAVTDIVRYVERPTIIAIISTVLPGTMRREIIKLGNENTTFVYNPQFIAMGTVMRDFLYPEFVLMGFERNGNRANAVKRMQEFYQRTLPVKVNLRCMSYESAELSKVAYNTMISSRLAVMNVLQELCYKLQGADFEDVSVTLKNANRRIISTAYMSAGIGDGGACHPRDNIAMSWLSRACGLTYNVFEQAMVAREQYAKFIADLAVTEAMCHPNKDLYMLGYAYKPNTNITTGSHALLIAHFVEKIQARTEHLSLKETFLFQKHDPYIEGMQKPVDVDHARVYLIGCNHNAVITQRFPRGSVIIDPFHCIPPRKGLKVVPLGKPIVDGLDYNDLGVIETKENEP